MGIFPPSLDVFRDDGGYYELSAMFWNELKLAFVTS
jgi:hypothetical protein